MSSRADTTASPAHRPTGGPAGRSQVFVFEDGFMFSCEGMVAPRTERYTATLLLATSAAGLGVDVAGERRQVEIALLKPFVPKSLQAPGQPFVSIGINPLHPRYRSCTRMAAPGIAAMPGSLFPTLAPRLQALRAGELDVTQARSVFDQCIEAVTGRLPPLRPVDARIARVTALLAIDHRRSLDTLAGEACLSYYRMSHLFSHEMGLSLRQYVLSLKIHAAARCIGAGMSLTATAHEAGFTDSAHLSKVWSKAFGGPPSHFLNERAFSIRPAPERSPSLRHAA